MQPRIVRLEMPGEPRVEPLRQQPILEEIVDLVVLHEVPDFIEQTFVIALVLTELVIAALAHEAFLEGKMRRYPLVEVAKEADDGDLRALRLSFLVQPVDQIDQFPV